MSGLGSAIDEMTMVSNDDLSAEELTDQIVELTYCSQQVDVLVAEKTRALSSSTADPVTSPNTTKNDTKKDNTERPRGETFPITPIRTP